MSGCLTCVYCLRDNFATSRALSQHLSKNDDCRAQMEARINALDDAQSGTNKVLEFATITRHKYRHDFYEEVSRVRKAPKVLDTSGVPLSRTSYDEYVQQQRTAFEDSDEDFDVPNYDSSDDDNLFDNFALDTENVVETLRDNFKNHCDSVATKFPSYLETRQEEAITLLALLRESNAPLCLYERVMEWFFCWTNRLYGHQSLGESVQYVNRNAVYDALHKRYNVDKQMYNIEKTLTLPSSGTKVTLILNDASFMFQSLLTDPRIKDDDYLFFDNDPFAPPPATINEIGDINTGRAYMETYKKLITKPGKQVLLPVIFYIDGAATGHFVDLKITAVKFTFGILNRNARGKHYLWRTLGYIPELRPARSRANRMYVDSNHMDAELHRNAVHENEGRRGAAGAKNAQDYHTILAIILESMLPLQDNGFRWDFFYRGKEYKDVEFVPFVPFISCDTDEADGLCGSYKSRNKGVKQLCRYCLCPTRKADRPFANFLPKTVPMIQELVENEDKAKLKKISQQFLQNATYLLRFGAHNDTGVHGGTPLELLHALYLGIFMYVRDCFFEQTGPDSNLSVDINSLCIQYGKVYSRQSERDMPKTAFTKGIRKGKLQAKEFVGIMLVLLTAIRSTKGRKLLTDGTNKENNKVFLERGVYKNWLTLLDTLLQWDSWLTHDVMLRQDVERTEKKHLWIMYLIKKVGRRQTGMKLKLLKFHAIMHMTEDIYNFGVPSNYDTGPMEAGHKPVKVAAKVTQKKEDTFEKQTNQRLMEKHLLNLALEEIDGRPPWRYSSGYHHSAPPESTNSTCTIGGAQYTVRYNDNIAKYEMVLMSNTRTKDVIKVEQEYINWVANLQNKIRYWRKTLTIYSVHNRHGVIFRASPNYLGEIWRDWVLIDWGDPLGKLPSKIYGFLDLRFLPDANNVDHGGYKGIEPAIYAIVEYAKYDKEIHESFASELFMPIRTHVGEIRQRRVTKLRLYLADVEAFVDPITVVPDIGGPPNAYFHCKSRDKWREDFIAWLHRDHLPQHDTDDENSNGENEDSDDFDM